MTPVAYVAGGTLYLERMNLLSEEGVGILCPGDLPVVGQVVDMAFRLSTAKRPVRCKGLVVGDVPMTPGGLGLKQAMGEKAFLAALGAASHGDSATMMFRLSDVQAALAETPAAEAREQTPPEGPHGFSVRFQDLSAEDKAAVARHVATSRKLSQSYTVKGGRVVPVTEDDGRAMGAAFQEGDLSQWAKDW
jgi:hypothetical protein